MGRGGGGRWLGKDDRWQPLYREVTVKVIINVPPREMLPLCQSKNRSDYLCRNRAKYEREDESGRMIPVCGVHLSSPATLLWDGE